ncbi:hypothetical protein CPB85DRAFT_284192 [Mucidula mucida]|nr:hypothetical protein CPB85DRAFT_284192 [Mucidula mucida]
MLPLRAIIFFLLKYFANRGNQRCVSTTSCFALINSARPYRVLVYWSCDYGSTGMRVFWDMSCGGLCNENRGLSSTSPVHCSWNNLGLLSRRNRGYETRGLYPEGLHYALENLHLSARRLASCG